MAQHCIKGKRIRRVCIPKEYDIDKIQIGIPVICDEAKKVGLIKNGDVVLPSGIFGAQCRRNAYGYSYADNLYKHTAIDHSIRRIVNNHNAEEEVKAKKEHREPIMLPFFSCHTFRHTFCTRFCENETNVKVIQSVMGHTDINTTMDIY